LQKAANPESDIDLITNGIKGMMQVENKNIIKDLTSKKLWSELKVPEEIIKGLALLEFTRPSLIQSYSLPHIDENRTKNFVFQSLNGSGKTGAFIVPSLMRVDSNLPQIQVLVLANTRELTR